MKPSNQELKETIYQKLLGYVDVKIDIVKERILVAKESRDSETKSTAGDKYETSRALMQTEIENCETQLQILQQTKHELLQINIVLKHSVAMKGNLVCTNQGDFFISTGLGKIDSNTYAISLASPIGEMLLGKTIGSTFTFQGKEFQILDIA